MEQVLILGLDVHGIELAGRITQLGTRRFMGFVGEDCPSATYGGYPVYSPDEALGHLSNSGFIPLHVWRMKEDPFADRWVSHIDPTCIVSADAVIEPGCILYPHSFVGSGAHLMRGVFALAGCVINHDCIIGERATLTSHVTLAGGVHVGERAYLGQACNVRQHLTIGNDAFVGMGAVVTKDVPAGQTVIGNPARIYSR